MNTSTEQMIRAVRIIGEMGIRIPVILRKYLTYSAAVPYVFHVKSVSTSQRYEKILSKQICKVPLQGETGGELKWNWIDQIYGQCMEQVYTAGKRAFCGKLQQYSAPAYCVAEKKSVSAYLQSGLF